MRLPQLPILTPWFDCYVTGWQRLCLRVGCLRLLLGHRPFGSVPVQIDWVPRRRFRVVAVELWALGGEGRLRHVRMPTGKELGAVFHYGQNEVQPQGVRSVSCGDIIRWEGKRYLILASGFRRVPASFIPDGSDPLIGYR